MPAELSLSRGALPIGLGHGVPLVRDVAEGEVVTWDDVAIDDTRARCRDPQGDRGAVRRGLMAPTAGGGVRRPATAPQFHTKPVRAASAAGRGSLTQGRVS